MGKIDCEAHFYTKEYLDTLRRNQGHPGFVYNDENCRSGILSYFSDLQQPFSERLLGALLDVGDQRLKVMDSFCVDMQILSLSAPGVEQLDPRTSTALAKRANDELFEAIQKHSDRFRGYAALAPNDPEAAADELERTVKDFGFVGWNTHSNYGDSAFASSHGSASAGTT